MSSNNYFVVYSQVDSKYLWPLAFIVDWLSCASLVTVISKQSFKLQSIGTLFSHLL